MTNASFIVGGRQEIIVVTAIVPVAAAAYATGNVLGDLIAIPNLGDMKNDELVLIEALLADAAKQNIATDLFLFDTNPTGTTFTDQSAVAVVAADLAKMVDVVSLAAASYVNVAATRSIVTARNLRIPFVPPASQALYAALVTRGAPTYTASCLTLKLSFSKRQV